MKFQKTLCLVLLVFLTVSGAEAQIFKRLKDKTKEKLERKVEQTIDKEIDSFSLKKNKNKKQQNPKEHDVADKTPLNSTSGSAILKHSLKYGNYSIDEFGKATLERINEAVKIFGSWVTHGTDIHDGYVLEIPSGYKLLFENGKPKQTQIVLSIPEDATLKLSYDPIWEPELEDENGFSWAVTKDYQSYNLEAGKVTIDVVSKDNIQFSFSGEIQLETRIKNPNNSEDEYTSSYELANLTGAIDVGPIQFLDNRIKEKPNKDTQEFDMPSISGDATASGIYHFTFETEVNITDLDENETYKISYLMNPEAKYIGMKADMSAYSDEEVQGESIIVMDGDDVHIFVEAEGMKMRMSQGMMGGQQMQNPSKEMANYDYTKLTKTGRTKTILGASCNEYTMSDDKVKIELWAAPSVNLPNWFVQNNSILEGHIMEYTISSKDGNVRSETTAINDHISKTINPKEYRKMF